VVLTLIVFLATCGSFVFVILSSVSLDLVKVVIPSCAFCIQMKILCNAHLLGELESYGPYQVCVIGRHILFGALCHHKFVEGIVCLELCSLIESLISLFLISFILVSCSLSIGVSIDTPFLDVSFVWYTSSDKFILESYFQLQSYFGILCSLGIIFNGFPIQSCVDWVGIQLVFLLIHW